MGPHPLTQAFLPTKFAPISTPAMPYSKDAATGKWNTGAGSKPIIPDYTPTGGTPADQSAIEEIILNFANFESVDAWAAFSATQPKECLFIRPSGNPITLQGLVDMMTTNGDITGIDGKLVEINKLDIVGDMAYAAVTQTAQFKYQGNPNDDLYVNSYVFKKTDGKWGMVYGHRSSGRKPSEGPITGW